jgi:sphingomyelin phosphodiesterase
LFYDNSDAARVTSIAFIGPSVTPYYDLNPGYRIYYVDADHPQTTRVSSHLVDEIIQEI